VSVWESTSRFERECEAEQDAQLKINGRDGCMRRLGTGLELLLLVKSEGAGEGVDELLLEMERIFSRKEVLILLREGTYFVQALTADSRLGRWFGRSPRV
jgi:hypothetical protein